MILVGGDSFTDKNYQGTTKWIYHIEPNEHKVINTAVHGVCNHFILYQILNALHTRNDISHLIIALTEWTRYPSPYVTALNSDNRLDVLLNDDRRVQVSKLYPTRERDIIRRTNDILMLLYTVMIICKQKNIRVTCFQMLDFASIQFRQRFISAFVKSPYADLISELYQESPKMELIDWPNWPINPGIASHCRKRSGAKLFQISENDTHPSNLGHELLATYLEDRSKFL